MQLGIVLLQILLLALVALVTNVNTYKTYDELFAEGLKQYFDQNYSGTARTMRLAVDDYLELVKAREKCIETCEEEPIRVPGDYAPNDELHFFHGIVQRGWCLEHCKMKSLQYSFIQPVSADLEERMERRDAYNYIQFALFQEEDLPSAASAAAIYHYYHPDNDLAIKNLALYNKRAEVTEGDLEVQDNIEYIDFWKEGVAAYHSNDYEEMVKYMEMSLEILLHEVDRCRSLCKGPVKNKDNYFFAEGMSEHTINVFECRYNCPRVLGKFRDDFEESKDFLTLYFHYLAYGYLKIGKMPEAARAATTHKRLAPHSDIARMNSAYIMRQVGVSSKDFKEREDVKNLLDELDKENTLLKIVNEVSGKLVDGVLPPSQKSDETLLEEDYNDYPVGYDAHLEEDSLNLSMGPKDSSHSYFVVETPKDHGGIERLVVDGMLSQEQCQMLVDLAKFGTEGDGYQKKFPHTRFEKFEGITVIDAAKTAAAMQVDPDLVKLYINASSMVKDAVASEFNLLRPLYFSYTHLVCRTAREDVVQKRSDLSHPVHSDNCVLNEESGECHKVPPAYTWRDYSAILYLNGEFEGGKFFFAHSPKNLNPEVFVQPKCGRMVGFSAGKENMHGVTAVTKGKRCALALWFTQDPNYQETAHLEALAILKQTSVA